MYEPNFMPIIPLYMLREFTQNHKCQRGGTRVKVFSLYLGAIKSCVEYQKNYRKLDGSPRGGCGSRGRVGCPLIGRSVVSGSIPDFSSPCRTILGQDTEHNV